MSFISQIVDLFRSGGSGSSASPDRFGILTPLTETIDTVEKTQTYLKLFMTNNKVALVLRDRTHHVNSFPDKAKTAYQLYLKALSQHDLAMERQVPLNTAVVALEAIRGNLELIEDNFQKLFGETIKDPSAMRTSSLVVIGYIETASAFVNWITQLTNHLVPEQGETITPFVTKALLDNSENAGRFVSNNLGQWSPRYKGFLTFIGDMGKKGTDVVIKSGDNWLDSFVTEKQFSSTEQSLIIAGFSNPILSWATGRMVKRQEQIELETNRKNWIISKIAMEEAKMHGTDPSSPEYAKLKHAIEYYASQVSKQEQKIERLSR